MSADPRIEAVVKMAERLIAVLEADIAALQKGKPGEMKTLEPEIQLLTAQYAREAGRLNRHELEAAPADQRARLTAVTTKFREALMLHGRILTRIRNASEGMIKAVADEVEKRRSRSRPYSAPYGVKPTAARPTSSAMLYNAVI
jgi:hypothetical protein